MGEQIERDVKIKGINNHTFGGFQADSQRNRVQLSGGSTSDLRFK